jgi:hypothetical protein
VARALLEVLPMTTAMVVMEPGGDWPGQVGDSTDVVALRHEGEELLRRTEERIGALHRGKRAVRIAVLACGSAAGAAAVGQRTRLARMLLGAVVGAASGQLILSASERASDQLRRELFVLAGELTEQLQGKTATICVRFTPSTPT